MIGKQDLKSSPVFQATNIQVRMENRNWVSVLFVVDILRLRSYRTEARIIWAIISVLLHTIVISHANKSGQLGENIDAQIHKE